MGEIFACSDSDDKFVSGPGKQVGFREYSLVNYRLQNILILRFSCR